MKNIFSFPYGGRWKYEVKMSEVKVAWNILYFCFLVMYTSFVSQAQTHQKLLIKILFSFPVLVFKSIKKQSLAYLQTS